MILCCWLQLTEFAVFVVYLFPPSCPVPIFMYGDLVVFNGDFFFFYIEYGLPGIGVTSFFLLSLIDRFFSGLVFSIFRPEPPISMKSRLTERSMPFFLDGLWASRGELSLPSIALIRFAFCCESFLWSNVLPFAFTDEPPGRWILAGLLSVAMFPLDCLCLLFLVTVSRLGRSGE